MLFGVFLGALYDFSRFLRIDFRIRFFADFFFWIISAFCTYSFFLVFTNGNIRMLYFVIFFTGSMLYLYTLGYVTKRIETGIYRMIIKMRSKVKKYLKNITKKLKKLLHLPYNIYYNKKRTNKAFTLKRNKGECDEREKG